MNIQVNAAWRLSATDVEYHRRLKQLSELIGEPSWADIPTAPAKKTLTASERLVLAETLRNYVQRLQQMGIKRIGAGEYGWVFQHPTLDDVVVKLLMEKDQDYLSWVEFCLKTKNNPYLPEIFEVSQDKKRFDPEMFKPYGSSNLLDMHLVFMEKLEPLSEAEYRDFGTYVAKVANRLIGEREYQGGRRTEVELNLDTLWRDLAKQQEDLHLQAVARRINRANTIIDLHKGNIMRRGTQVVITDPFVSKELR